MKPMRKVITTKNAPKTLKTRRKVAVELARLLDSGEINIDNVFVPDETWLDTSAPQRLNAQYDRVYFESGAKKCDVVGQLEQGKPHRSPGIMVHLAVSSFGGGDVLEPYFYAPGEHVTAEKYVFLSQGTVFRQIEAAPSLWGYAATIPRRPIAAVRHVIAHLWGAPGRPRGNAPIQAAKIGAPLKPHRPETQMGRGGGGPSGFGAHLYILKLFNSGRACKNRQQSGKGSRGLPDRLNYKLYSHWGELARAAGAP